MAGLRRDSRRGDPEDDPDDDDQAEQGDQTEQADAQQQGEDIPQWARELQAAVNDGLTGLGNRLDLLERDTRRALKRRRKASPLKVLEPPQPQPEPPQPQPEPPQSPTSRPSPEQPSAGAKDGPAKSGPKGRGRVRVLSFRRRPQ